MKRHVFCVSPALTVAEAARQMREQQLAFLPVCGDEGQVVGVVTAKDIALRACGAELPPGAAIGRIMSRRPIACKKDDPIERAEELMAQHGVHRVLVLDDTGTLAGVLTLADIAQCEEPIRLARLVRAVSAHDYRIPSSRG
jgi:CBS domain-containing protein